METGKNAGKRISLKLSPEQQRQVQDATGRRAEALELTIDELEARIAPMGPLGY